MLKSRSVKILMGLLFSATLFAQTPPATMPEFVEQAKNCQDSRCAQENVALIDSQIVALIGQRLAFAKREEDLQPLRSPIRDQQNNQAILDNVSQQATRVGYSPMIARFVYNSILTQTNIYEQYYRRNVTNFQSVTPTPTPSLSAGSY